MPPGCVQALAARAAGVGAGATAAATARGVPPRRLNPSRFAAGGVSAGGDGAASTPAAAAAASADPFVRALERPRPKVYTGPRIIVFVVGGISLAEIAALERISALSGREIVYGGTSVMTPRDALDQLLRTDDVADEDRVGAAGVGGE